MPVIDERQRITSLLGYYAMLFRLLGKACRNTEAHETEQLASSAFWRIVWPFFWSVQIRKIRRDSWPLQRSASISSCLQYGRYELNAYQMDRGRNDHSFINTYLMFKRGVQFWSFVKNKLYAVVYNWKLFWAFLEDWKENVKGSLLPCYNSSEGQPLDRIISSFYVFMC